MEQAKFDVRPDGHVTPVGGQQFSIVLALFVLMSMGIFVSTLPSRLTEQSPVSDLFLAYVNVFPGQPASATALEEHGFLCFMDTLPSPADASEYCSSTPQTGLFSRMNVTIWDGVVTRVEFTVNENLLSVGHLALLWGRPEDIQVVGNIATARWSIPGATVLAIFAYDQRFSYFAPVAQVSIKDVGSHNHTSEAH